jgi:hypothetical protein
VADTHLWREAWLNKVADTHLWPLIKIHGGEIQQKVRISIGFPKGSRGGKHSVGQCWAPSYSGDSTHEIFVSPVLGAPDAVSTLLHELIHASVGLKCKHKGAFKRLALAVGLEGKMTATEPGKELAETIKGWLAKLPEYPHAPMKVGGASSSPKQGTRLIKASCPECGYTVRVTQKWLEIGNPRCPNHDELEVQS